MKRKFIKKIIEKKIDEWISSIEDTGLRDMVRKNCMVTGGSIVSLLTNEKVKDYDVYFRNKETALKVTEYYVRKFKETHPNTDIRVDEKGDNKERVYIHIQSKGIEGDEDIMAQEPGDDVFDVLEEEVKDEKEEKPSYRPVFLSCNAITLSNRVQLVIRFYGEPEEIHKNYDFIHCVNFWTSWDKKLILDPRALEAIINKELIYIGSKYPLCSVLRTKKFILRGWSINAGQYLKMLFQVSQLNLLEIDNMADQLIGVDSAYFGIIIEALKSKRESEPGFQVNTEYLGELIDRVFQ